MEAETVEVDLGVLEGLNDTGPGEFFVSGGVAVILKTSDYAVSLFGSEESGSCGVVVDDEVSEDGGDDSHKTLLGQYVSRQAEDRSRNIYDNEDPPPTSQAGNASHFGNSIRLKACERHVEDEGQKSLANIPPNAPARVGAVAKIAIRYCCSFRLYHMLR